MPGGYIYVCIEETAGFRIVVSAVEIIPSGFGIVVIPAVAEGIHGADGGVAGIGHRQELAPGVVGIGDHLVSILIVDIHHIAKVVGNKEVFDEEVLHMAGIAVTNSDGRALGVVEVDKEVLNVVLGPALAQNGIAHESIGVNDAICRLARADVFSIVRLRREI